MPQFDNPFNTIEFLNQYWQQNPILMRQAFDLPDLIDADELAGLALEDSVESRIISHEPETDAWHLKHGPFSEDDFNELPENHWTLLVQAVDHWIPEVRALMKSFRFLPQWRIDDIMISFATPGGGVGPHFDQYDVFLIQLEGKREWKIGQTCDESSDLVDQMPVKILADFQEQDKWVLEPGDVLYLPPALAHWGTSVDNSITLSVGFRAPAVNEVVSDFGHYLSSVSSDFNRYHDAELSNRSNRPHEILNEDIHRLQSILQDLAKDERKLAQWFGQYMTEPKYDDSAVDTGDWSLENFVTHWQQHPLARNASSRLAYFRQTVFVDGQQIDTTLSETQLNAICDSEFIEFQRHESEMDSEFKNVLWQLSNIGALFFED